MIPENGPAIRKKDNAFCHNLKCPYFPGAFKRFFSIFSNSNNNNNNNNNNNDNDNDNDNDNNNNNNNNNNNFIIFIVQIHMNDPLRIT